MEVFIIPSILTSGEWKLNDFGKLKIAPRDKQLNAAPPASEVALKG
jgi:hypothetical protein